VQSVSPPGSGSETWTIANPGSIPELAHLATWLDRNGVPVRYCSPLVLKDSTINRLSSRPLAACLPPRMSVALGKRALCLGRHAKTRHFGWFLELLYLGSRGRLPALAGTVLTIRNRYFDWRVAQTLPRGPGVVVGRHTASLRTMRAAIRKGVTGVLDYSIVHHATLAAVQSTENARFPQLASSFREAPSGRERRRLDAELATAKLVLTFSAGHAASMTTNGVASEKIIISALGVDLGQFPAQERPIDRKGPLRVVFVGQITQRKGVGDLLEVYKLLLIDNVLLTLVGGVKGDIRDSLKVPGVEVRGPVARANLAAIYRDADLFVFLSTAEGFPQTPLEAMATGLPVILSHQAYGEGGPVVHGKEGFLVDPRQHQRIARLIEDLRVDPEKRRLHGHAAAATARSYTWDAFSERVFRRVSGGAGSPSLTRSLGNE
jgi:glycosyltransferase involved in cell wall biosynthesis